MNEPWEARDERLERLEAERQAHKSQAERLEARAADALRRGDREGWDRFARAADLLWQMNAWCVGEIDRLAAC